MSSDIICHIMRSIRIKNKFHILHDNKYFRIDFNETRLTKIFFTFLFLIAFMIALQMNLRAYRISRTKTKFISNKEDKLVENT